MTFVCPDSQSIFLGLLDPRIAPHLLFYSYLPIIFVSLFFGFFVLFKDKFSLQSKLLLSISISFSLFLLNEIVQWIAAPVSFAFLGWNMAPFFQIMVWNFSIYFFCVYLYKKALSAKNTIILLSFSLPVLVLLPTRLNFSHFVLDVCEGRIGPLWYYLYSFEVVSIIFLMWLGFKKYRAEHEDKKLKKQILLLTLGISFFLLIFFLSNISGEILKNYGEIFKTYQINLIGPVGMVFFLGLLAYLIVKYKAFNIKLIATQALVAALIIGIGSQFFFIQNTTNIILNGVTLALVLSFGYMLVKSVKLEVQRKEELQSLSDQLSDANAKLRQLDKAKSEFISIASHQLRTPLTSIKGFGSLLLEGTYGEVPEAQRGALEKIYISNERLIQLVEDLLNISRIEAGRMEFDFQEAQIEDLVQEAVQTLELSAKAKNLYLHWEKPAIAMPKLKIDITKIKEVISNMVDNSIKYTQKGGITGKLEANTVWDTEHKDHKESVRVIVSDTGIGMDAEELAMIFEKFQRGKQVSHYHTDGTGLGMFIGRKIVAEHKGKIWAESDGKGKGSRFILELPVG
jgi:signal transduction histidine kinase